MRTALALLAAVLLSGCATSGVDRPRIDYTESARRACAVVSVLSAAEVVDAEKLKHAELACALAMALAGKPV